MKPLLYLSSLLGLLLTECTRRPFSNWFVEEVSKPNCTQVKAVRLTPDYTVLDVQFTNQAQTFYTHKQTVSAIGYICVSPNTKLIGEPGGRTYSLIKAEGIRVLPHLVKVGPFDEIQFYLYFERLDEGVETVDWIDDFEKDNHRFHYEFLDLPVNNPTDTFSVR